MAGRSKKKRSRRSPNPATKLTDDLLVEILARVPYKSLSRFRCVSRLWRDLIADPDHRRKLPQTLAGFFYSGGYGGPSRCFVNVSGPGRPFVDPELAFLPDHEQGSLDLLDICNGLLLCRRYRPTDSDEFDYLVLNPATEKWFPVPIVRRWSSKVDTVRLGFDPAVSSHFHVFEFDPDWSSDVDEDDYIDDDDDGDGHVLGVKIYSSGTGVWSHKQSGWDMNVTLNSNFKSAFVNGMLYVVALECVIGALDVEGKTWRTFEFPRSKDSPFFDTAAGFIDSFQGRLHFANTDDIKGNKLAIWVLEDHDTEEWTLKHMVSFRYLVGKKHVQFAYHEFVVAAIHPDRNMVFFVFGRDKTLMSYDMDSKEVLPPYRKRKSFWTKFGSNIGNINHK